MKVACWIFTILALSTLVSCEPGEGILKPSEYTLRGLDDGERVCLFRNLVIFRGRFFYLSEEEVELPSIPAFRPGPWKVDRIHIEVMNLKQLLKVLHVSANVPQKTLRWAALVHRVHTFSWGFHMLDEAPNLHRMLCRNIPQLCAYDRSRLVQAWLIFYDQRSRSAAKFNRIWACFSHNRPIYAHKSQDDMYEQVVILDTAVVGWQWGSLVHDFGWPAEFAGPLHRRLSRCLGLDRDLTVGDLSRQRVTLVRKELADLPFKVSPIVERMRKRFPAVAWHAVDVDLLTAEESAEVFHSSSVIVNINGNLQGSMMFMRQGAVLVDLVPLKEYVGMAFAVEMNMKHVLKVTTRTYTRLRSSSHRSTLWEVTPTVTNATSSGATASNGTAPLPPPQRRDHRCPADLAAHCQGHVIYLRPDVKVTAEVVQRVMLDGLALLADVNQGRPVSIPSQAFV